MMSNSEESTDEFEKAILETVDRLTKYVEESNCVNDQQHSACVQADEKSCPSESMNKSPKQPENDESKNCSPKKILEKSITPDHREQTEDGQQSPQIEKSPIDHPSPKPPNVPHTITLQKMKTQPAPVAKILPKPSSVSKQQPQQQNAQQAPSLTTPSMDLINSKTKQMSKFVRHPTAAGISKDGAGQLIIGETATMPGQIHQAHTMNKIVDEFKTQLSTNSVTYLPTRPNVIPIRPRISTGKTTAIATTMLTTTTPNLVVAPPTITTTNPANSASSDEFADHLATTVNKVAAGTEITPNREDVTIQKALIPPKAKDKKKKASTESKAKASSNPTTALLPAQNQANGMVGAGSNKVTKCGETIPSSTILTTHHTSGYIFPNPPQFALASNGNLVAVSNGGMTHYLIRQQANATGHGHIIPVMPTQQLFVSSVQPAVDPNKNQSTNLQNQQQQYDGMPQQTQILPQQSQISNHSKIGGQNILFRPGPNANIFMPTIIPRQNFPASTTNHLSQTNMISSQGSRLKFIQRKPDLNNQRNVNTTMKNGPIFAMEQAHLPQPQNTAATTFTSSSMIMSQDNLVMATNINADELSQNGKSMPMAETPSKSTTTSKAKGKATNIVTPSKSRNNKKKVDSSSSNNNSNQNQIPTMLASGQQIVDEEENEPPPVLCRDDSTANHPVESLFQKEAKIIHEKMFDSAAGRKGPLIHEIDGFRIEEDVQPFPVEHQKLLEKLKDTKPEENIAGKSQKESPKEKDEKTAKTRKRNHSSSSSDDSTSSESPSKMKFPSSSSKDKTVMRKARRRELEGLLKMDFGPGKTPFQTSDPDEYAEEVMIEATKQKKTLALAAEEHSKGRSVERPSSSSKNKKEKSNSKSSKYEKKHSYEGGNEYQDEVKSPNEKDSTRNESVGSGKLSIESKTDQEHCSYCKRLFTEVGRDRKHEQYCSKECRKNKKQLKKLKSKSIEGNLNATNQSPQNFIPNRRSDPSTPSTSSATATAQQKMTSPLGSAFSTVQPQMFTNNGTVQMGGEGSMKRRWTLDEQATQLSNSAAHQQHINARTSFDFGDGIGTQAPQNAGEQMFVAGSSNHVLHHPAQMMGGQLPMQPPPHFPHHISPYFNHQPNITDNLSFGAQQAQHIHQQQMMMPNASNFFANQFQMMQQSAQFQHAIRHPQLVPSPVTPTITTPSLEKNMEIDALVARGIQTWTPEEVAKWVKNITNSESIGASFVEQEIDGSSLVLLTCEQLQNELKLKLGPAVKLNNALNALKAKSYMN